MTRKLHRIVSQFPPSWEPGGNPSSVPAPSPDPPATSALSPSVSKSDGGLDKAGVAGFLGISIRSWDRAQAEKVTPQPDLWCGRSPRWLRSTITTWLKTRPKLPSRGGRRGRRGPA
jgi:predicted DNA-binding transcriptional regulator AlpA